MRRADQQGGMPDRPGVGPPNVSTVTRALRILLVAWTCGCGQPAEPPAKASEAGRHGAAGSSNRPPKFENPSDTGADYYARELPQNASSEQEQSKRVDDTEHQAQEANATRLTSLLQVDDPMLAAIESRFGKPDGVMQCDERLHLDYNLENGRTLSLVASGTAYGARRLRIVDMVYSETEHLNHFIGLNVTMIGKVQDDGKFGEYLQTHRRMVYLPYGITRVRQLPLDRMVAVTGLLDYQPPSFPAHDDKGQAVATRPAFYRFRERDIKVELVEDRADDPASRP